MAICDLVWVKVKICGITTLEDAEAAVEAGAWAIGINRWPGSPRYIDGGMARAIAMAMKRRVEVAGIFVNPTLDEVSFAAESEGLTMVQLHGDEGPAFCAEVRRRTAASIIKAFRVRTGADVKAAWAFRTNYHLFDAYNPELRGGTGEHFDWALVRSRRRGLPTLLAGGITPQNVAEAVEAALPWGIDVASGVEISPGRKDHYAIAQLIERAEAADPRHQRDLARAAEREAKALADSRLDERPPDRDEIEWRERRAAAVEAAAPASAEPTAPTAETR